MSTQETDSNEMVGLTVGDGFKFGCGFGLAMVLGLLATMVILTGFAAIAIFMGIKIPFLF